MTFIPVIYDIEIYYDRFCIAFKRGNEPVKVLDDLDKILKIPFENEKYRFIGYNNRRYDQPIIEALLRGKNKKQLWTLSNQIIQENKNAISWNKNIIDLYEICPKFYKNGGATLKEFGHRLDYPVLKNLPFPFDQELTDEEWQEVKDYCIHDVNITALLWDKLHDEYDTRQELSHLFDITTEFGGAPNLAQKCILSKLEDARITTHLKLHPQNNLILSPLLKSFYDEGFSHSLTYYRDGERPEFMLKKHNIKGLDVKIEVGGLHGFGKAGIYQNVYEYDVSSYYPSLILNCKLGSAKFRRIYQMIYNKRLKLKKQGSVHAKSLKLVLNSLYGKMNDYKYGHEQIYAPNVALSICLLGQFYLLDLIEKLDNDQVILANTDGLFVKYPIEPSILKEWEKRTGFNMECNKYKIFIAKDVNSYFARDDDGNEERRKEFRNRIWTHNVRANAIQKLALAKLLDEPLEKLKPIDFCFFSKATGDKKLLLNGEELSDNKVRYYVSTGNDVLERLSEKSKSRLVAGSGVTLLMNIPEDMGYLNLNREWYAQQANKLIKSVKGESFY